MFVSLHRQAFRNNALVSKVQRALLSAVTKDKQKIIARYTTVPLKLFRIVGSNNKVILREKEKQFSKGSRSYDYTATSDGLLHPAPLDDYFFGPNGVSLRPAGVPSQLSARSRNILNAVFSPKPSNFHPTLWITYYIIVGIK